MMPKIAIVVSHPIQHFCPQYASWSRGDGYTIKVFFASRHGLDAYHDKNFATKIQWSGLRLDFPHVFLPGSEERSLSASIDCLQLTAELGLYRPDAVIVYGYRQPLQRRAIAWAKSKGLRLIMIADSELRQHRSVFKSLIKKVVVPNIFKKIDLFMTVGDSNEQYYRKYGVQDDKLIRSFFPIDVVRFDSVYQHRLESRETLRSELGIPPQETVVLNVGKHVSWKRQIDIVQASKRIQEAGHNVTFVLVGVGPEHERLKESAVRQGVGGVIFAGFIPPDKLAAYYSASDIYAHPSAKEPHSLAISEAIYMGLPVIVSDRCGSFGPTDDVQTGVNGCVYPCGDVEKFVSALLRMKTEKHIVSEFSIRSRQLGISHQSLAHGDALKSAINILF